MPVGRVDGGGIPVASSSEDIVETLEIARPRNIHYLQDNANSSYCTMIVQTPAQLIASPLVPEVVLHFHLHLLPPSFDPYRPLLSQILVTNE